MSTIKPKEATKYTWRTYLDANLERTAKIVAIQNGKDVREYLSEIISKNLPEVKILQ